MTAKGSRDAFLGVAESRVQSFFAVVLCMGKPLRARVLIEMVHFDGRWASGPCCARSCARGVMYDCEHFLCTE